MGSLFKSEKGKQEILQLYDQKLESLSVDFSYKTIHTSFGKTNIISTGNPQKPPIILIHGSNGNAPIALETYKDLLDSFSVYAVDVLAQPNKSAETRLSMQDDSYGKWMHEIIDELKLQNVILAGFSFGGLVILKTLIHNEQKIKEVFLTAPAYVVNGNPLKALFRFFIPMKRYMKTKKKKYLDRFLAAAFTEKDEYAEKSLALIFTHFTMDFTPVPVIKTADAMKISSPITLIAAENDILFPGGKMIRRAKKIFPSLKSTVLLEDSKHVQSKEENQRIAAIIKNNAQV
ncbi:Pimeloyl-ACP methyl ester carboxylesterase [Algoriphagus faecimaris]|uniref:Pimeloyl-ACP methyl ester carboxylesterase n=1 Tax=Algoriphagus faecimaris TaxID=686796 RepID=A0A1G6NB18_9BACT|nr:alpha/beta hydrolase [Algoriphagus faecimaris]SDC64365.1 Pimeloyl-ACP methyl ester carboxylesterase [Algoriphagus faecimaris]